MTLTTLDNEENLIYTNTNFTAEGDNIIYDETSNNDSFNNIEVNKILNSDGLVTAPSYSFKNDTDTGIYRKTDNTISISTGGTEQIEISNASTTINNPLYVIDNGIIFKNDTDTGIERSGTNAISFKTGGTSRMTIQDLNTTISNQLSLSDNGFIFTADTDTSITRPSTNAISFQTGGSQRLLIQDNFITIEEPLLNARLSVSANTVLTVVDTKPHIRLFGGSSQTLTLPPFTTQIGAYFFVTANDSNKTLNVPTGYFLNNVLNGTYTMKPYSYVIVFFNVRSSTSEYQFYVSNLDNLQSVNDDLVVNSINSTLSIRENCLYNALTTASPTLTISNPRSNRIVSAELQTANPGLIDITSALGDGDYIIFQLYIASGVASGRALNLRCAQNIWNLNDFTNPVASSTINLMTANAVNQVQHYLLFNHGPGNMQLSRISTQNSDTNFNRVLL